MPMYDYQCQVCGYTQTDVLTTIADRVRPCPQCVVVDHPGPMQRVWLTKAAGVISDECDVWVKHGICNEDGTPRRYTSKAEMRREAERRGYVNHVVHQGTKSGDKSPHTTRWV